MNLKTIKMKNTLLKIALLIIVCTSFINCSSNDDNDNNQNNSRNIKYEISGNYSGHLTVVYNDNISGNTVVTVTSLPWSKEVTYNSSVQVIGIGASSVVGHYGAAGQSATLKIYDGDTVVKNANASTNANGLISFAPLAYGL